MIRRHFTTRADLELQMEAQRQLCAEILAGAARVFRALAGALGAIRRMLLRIITREPRQA